jgi:hypothetical protein
MRYLLLICGDDDLRLTPEEEATMGPSTEAWVAEMTERGVRLEGNRLAAAADATTVRLRDGEVVISDGPFAETKEQVAGYDLLDCADLDEAIEIASKHPMARFGTIEIRPFWSGP